MPFAGWEMPVHYPAGIRAEHLAARGAAGVFDVSHMGQIETGGPGRADRPQRDLRVLGRLMAAEHVAELRLMRSWWRGWYGGDLPAPTDDDQARMKGMPADDDTERLRREGDVAFDRLFCDLMIPHHEGGIAMARELVRTGGDPRLKLLCVAIDHAQVGQVVRMRTLRP